MSTNAPFGGSRSEIVARMSEAFEGEGGIPQATIGANALDGTVAGNVAASNTEGGIPVVHRITAAALTGNVDVVVTHKTRVLDVLCIATALGGVGDTITVSNGASAITDAMDLNVADQTVVRAGTVNDANWEIAAGGTLRVAGASGANAEVIVTGIRVA